MKFSYTLRDKFLFFLSYLFYKFIVPFEVKRPRIKMFIYEMIYSFYKLIDYKKNLPYFFKDNLIVTKFGKFKIRSKTADAASVSPAYERRDVNFLIKKIDEKIKENKKVLFCDIGADIGYYSILIGNKFKRKIKIFSFEPLKESFELLKENININNLSDTIVPLNFALSDSEGEFYINVNILSPGDSSLIYSFDNGVKIKVKTKKLDDILGDYVREFDTVFAKIDVEGFEEKVLSGAKKFLENSKELILLIEDFINPEIINYLEKNNFKFLCKLTTYNSFWTYKL